MKFVSMAAMAAIVAAGSANVPVPPTMPMHMPSTYKPWKGSKYDGPNAVRVSTAQEEARRVRQARALFKKYHPDLCAWAESVAEGIPV